MRRIIPRALWMLMAGVLCLSIALGSCMTASAMAKKKRNRHVSSNTAPDDEVVTEEEYQQHVADTAIKRANRAMQAHVSGSSKLKKYTYLYVGASRVNRLSKRVKDSRTYFYASEGADASWFGQSRFTKKPCLLVIRSYLAVRPEGNVIIELGNNDLYHINVYIHVYKSLIEAYPQAHFWFVDALPGTGKKRSGAPRNAARIAFNNRLKEEFPENCVGGYDYLLHSSGFRTLDGVHYPSSVGRTLYKYVMGKLGRKIKYSGTTVVDVK